METSRTVSLSCVKVADCNDVQHGVITQQAHAFDLLGMSDIATTTQHPFNRLFSRTTWVSR